jgi:histidine kinase/DNA gyrase B/HSP90-like ATPase
VSARVVSVADFNSAHLSWLVSVQYKISMKSPRSLAAKLQTAERNGRCTASTNPGTTEASPLAVLFVVLAFGLTLALQAVTSRAYYILFVPAVMFAAWFGGLGAGLTASVATAGGEVHLIVEQHSAEVVIRVTDTGRGISSDRLSTIFEMFQTGDGEGGGLGVGLAVVKGLAEVHGGTVRATSPGLGRGSEFIVTLPNNIRPAA